MSNRRVSPFAVFAVFALVMPLAVGLLAEPEVLSVIAGASGETVAAWAQALLSAAAIFAAVLLQERERAAARRDRLQTIVTIARDAVDLMRSADVIGRSSQFDLFAVDFFMRAFDTRLEIIRSFDHGSYAAEAVAPVLRILTNIEQGKVICDHTSARLRHGTTLSGTALHVVEAFQLSADELDLATRELEDLAGLPHDRAHMVRVAP